MCEPGVMGSEDSVAPKKLKGWTAVEWGRPLRLFGVLSMIFAALSGACYLLVGGTAESIPWWLYVIFAATALNFATGMVFLLSGMVKAIRESRAGYTTTAG